MKELRQSEFISSVGTRKRPLLFLVAPNYEPRSVEAPIRLAPELSQLGVQFAVGVLQLQAQAERVEPLEDLKNLGKTLLLQSLHECQVEPIMETVQYPDGYSPVGFQRFITELAESTGPNPDILLDISALPRRILVTAFRTVRDLQVKGALGCLYVAYTWAEDYPSPTQPFEVGTLKAVELDCLLSDLVSEKGKVCKECWALVLPGRQGFDGRQLVDQLPPTRHVQVLAFLNRNKLLRSLDMLRANVSILVDRAFSVGYYLTLREAHSKLLNWAATVPVQRDTAYLVAPFGPKPLIFCAIEAVDMVRERIIEQRAENSRADMVQLSGHHYVSTYSEGIGDLSLFVWE